MKKTVTVVLLVCCAFAAFAQNFPRGAQLNMGQRWPTYYYWGDNWIDRQYDPSYPGSLGGGYMTGLDCKPEIARYIYADSSLRVIGIAAAYKFITHVEMNATDDPYNSYETDYFRLYEVDSLTDEMVLVAEKPLTDLSVACYMPLDDYGNVYGPNYFHHAPIREVYFDSAVTVHDSFYVAVTGNNNWRRPFSTTLSYVNASVMGVSQVHDNTPLCYPVPNHIKMRLHLIDGWNHMDITHKISDTNWHVIHMNFAMSSTDLTKPHESGTFVMIFPIIDTTPDQTWTPECKRPVNLGTVHAGREVVVLGWESEGSSRWELKVAKEGTDMDSVEPMACTGDVVPLYGLDTATWYAATVRSLCSGNRISDWSDTIRFFVPGDTASTDPTDPTEGFATPAERYTYLMPNPATKQVTVMSSFRIGKVTVYDAAGNRILRTEPNGMSATIDLTTLPSGVYIVSIATNRGTVHKRLIKK